MREKSANVTIAIEKNRSQFYPYDSFKCVQSFDQICDRELKKENEF